MTRPLITLISFSYKNGPVPEADTIYDCRVLRNPHSVLSLRQLDGRDKNVQAYVAADSKLNVILSEATKATADHDVLAFGCYGGRHRSVCVVELLARRLRDLGVPVQVTHQALSSSTTLASGYN